MGSKKKHVLDLIIELNNKIELNEIIFLPRLSFTIFFHFKLIFLLNKITIIVTIKINFSVNQWTNKTLQSFARFSTPIILLPPSNSVESSVLRILPKLQGHSKSRVILIILASSSSSR